MSRRPALPDDLWSRLAEFDPAREASTAPRPTLDSIIATADAEPGSADDVLVLVPATPPERRWSMRMALAAACVIVAAAGLITALLLTGGAPEHTADGPAPPGTSPLFDVTWVDHAADANLVFRQQTLEVSYGCERLYYGLTVTATRIHQGKQVPPSLVCPSASPPAPGSADYPQWLRAHRAQNELFHVLGSDPTWVVDGTTLVLTARSGATATLTSKGTARLTLARSSWRLAYFITARGAFGTSGGVHLSFGLHTFGISSTTAICETFAGQATINTSSVTLSSVEYAGHSCSNEVSSTVRAVSQTVNSMMRGTVDYSIDDNSLRLTKPGSKAVLGFVPSG